MIEANLVLQLDVVPAPNKLDVWVADEVGPDGQAPRRGPHSTKHQAFYTLVESCSPGPYLEMFARRGRDGWVSWGGELAVGESA